jgi:hypothetical protein
MTMSFAIYLAVVGMCAIHVHGECLYGTLPGVFRVDQPEGERWQLLTPKCHLQNYLQIYANKVQPDNPPPRLSMLFLTDSMDRCLMHAFCDAYKGKKSSPGIVGFNHCDTNGTTRLIIVQVRLSIACLEVLCFSVALEHLFTKSMQLMLQGSGTREVSCLQNACYVYDVTVQRMACYPTRHT